MAGLENDFIFGKNADFTQADNQNALEANGLFTDGQIWIGRTAVNAGGTHIDVNTLTAGTGVSITNGAGSITIGVSGSGVGQTITGNTGGALSPVAGNWNILGSAIGAGTTPVSSSGSGNTLVLNVQRSQAVASTDITRVGLASFNSGQFSVDSNGFVTSIGGAFMWVNVTGTTQTVAPSTGYLSNNAGTVTFSLPASSTFGDVFRIVGRQGAWTLTQAAGQQVLFGSGNTTAGAGGSLTSTNAGDCIELVATNTSASSIWRVMSSLGNITIV